MVPYHSKMGLQCPWVGPTLSWMKHVPSLGVLNCLTLFWLVVHLLTVLLCPSHYGQDIAKAEAEYKAKFGKDQKKSNFAQRKLMMVRFTYIYAISTLTLTPSHPHTLTLIYITFIGVTVGVCIHRCMVYM